MRARLGEKLSAAKTLVSQAMLLRQIESSDAALGQEVITIGLCAEVCGRVSVAEVEDQGTSKAFRANHPRGTRPAFSDLNAPRENDV